MHTALAILITLAQVAGPWLCCCGPERVSAAFAVQVDAKSAPPAQKPTSDCPHCKKPESPPAPVPTDSKPLHTPDPCPCGGVELVAVPVERVGEAADLVASAVEPCSFAAFTSTVISHAVASVPGLRELPIMTVRDRLYAHHVLRC
jgi:hypothetical protein